MLGDKEELTMVYAFTVHPDGCYRRYLVAVDYDGDALIHLEMCRMDPVSFVIPFDHIAPEIR
jgi:hypothetical protein